jgi:WD40 repeat protein
MAWSPTEDLLFAVGHARQNPDGTVFYLIDVAQQRIIITFTLNDETYGATRNIIRWSPDGRTVSFYYSLLSQEDGSIAQSFMRTITRDGVIQDNEIPSRVGIGDVWQVATPSPENRNNLYVTQDGTEIVIEIPSTGETRELNNPTESTRLKAEWSSTGEHALVFAEYPCEPFEVVCAELWLLAMEPFELVHITDTAAYTRYIPTEYWSPAGDIAHFTNVDGHSFLLNAVSWEVLPIEGLENVQVIHWSPNGRHLLAIGDSRYRLVEVESLQVHDVTPADFQLAVYDASFSPNSQYLAMAHPLHILDLEAGETHVYPAHSSAMNAGTHSYDFIWSPDQEWIVYSHVVFHAGGGGGPLANIVTNIDGSVWRELSVAFNQAEWLPARVIPYLPPEQE